MICGYCLLPVLWSDDLLTFIHSDGTPDVGPATPGDYVTAGHRPGARVGTHDIVEGEA